MKPIAPQKWSVPLALAGIVLLAYGVVIPWLGLYGDDWPYLWVQHVAGARGYIDFVAWDRPFSAWIYLLTTPLLGEQVWAYHLFLALLRWVCAVLLWWVMRLVWPQRGALAAWSAFLLAVYPGFRQQPIPLEFMLHFATLALFLFSLGMMVLAVRRPERRARYTALNLLGALGVFGLEYFVGLELLRPVLLWMVLANSSPQREALSNVANPTDQAPGRGALLCAPTSAFNAVPRLMRVLLAWLPNLIVLLAFVIWRALIFQFPSYQPTFLNTLFTQPLQSLSGLAVRVLSDLRAVTFGAWRQVFSFPEQGSVVWVYALAALGCAALVWWAGRSLPPSASVPAAAGGVEPEAGEAGRVGKSNARLDKLGERLLPMPLLLGVFTLLIAGWPFWLTGLPVSLSFPWDRSTLSFMLGASWLMAGLVEMFQPRYQLVLLAVLVGLAAGSQIQNAASYRVESQKLRDFFWQLAWRAPQLKPGAILLSEQIPLNYYGDNGLTPPLNWTYAPESRSTQQVYNFFDLDERLETTLPALEENLPIRRVYRSFSFDGNTSALLMAYYQPDRCLRVLGPGDALLPGLPKRLSESLALSHLDQIKADSQQAASPPAHLVGAEPEHTWCYWFESADLARQRFDWPMVIRAWRDAQDAGFEPKNLSELLPFIEGHARGGDLETAQALTVRAAEDGELRPALCALWKQLAKDLPGANAGVDLKCKPQ